MNKNRIQQINVLHLIFFILFIVISIKANAQCYPETYSLHCIEKLEEGYIYLKSYNIDGLNGTRNKVEYSVVFSKNTDYLLNICTESDNADGIILSIYDSKRKLIISNILNEVIQSKLKFNCGLTGIYYLTFTFQNSKKYCGGCILAFRK